MYYSMLFMILIYRYEISQSHIKIIDVFRNSNKNESLSTLY